MAGLTVNKNELAKIISCSLPTLNALIDRHGDDFPIITRGTNGREYEFDADAVVAYLRAKDDAARQAGAEREELMRQYTLPVETETPSAAAGLRPQELLALTRAEGLRRQQMRDAGFLVLVSDVRQTLTAAFIKLRQRQLQAVRQACRDSNIPEATIRTIEARIGEAQAEFVRETQRDLETGGLKDDQQLALN